MKLSSTEAQNSFKYTWLIKRIFPFVKPYLFRILIGFIIALPLGLLDGVTAYVLKPYMDFVISGKTFEYTLWGVNIVITSLQMAIILPLGVILFTAIQGLLYYINEYICIWTSKKITCDIDLKLFRRLLTMHPKFYDENPSGIIITRYITDPATASNGLITQLKTIVTTLCSSIGLVAVMLYSSWQLAIVGVMVLVFAFLPLSLLRKRIKKTSNKNMQISGNMTTCMNETYSGNKVMAAYKLQDRQYNYFAGQVKDFFNVNISLAKRIAWMHPLTHFIASIGIAVVLGYGTYLINSGHITSGSFASFIASLLLLYKPVKSLGNSLTNMQTIFVAMSRILELFDLESEIKEADKAQELPGVNDGITFENVNFEYVENTPVLKNINLNIPKGETLAIVGNSGGGKSTLVNLLPRFYDIKSGSIKIDGQDIRQMSLDSLRSNISMVFQDNFLFSGTIRENIMMGNPAASEEDLQNAVKSAHLEDVVAGLADGLDTLLGERGLTLSGGQRQRVAIARAMLRNAPIVILDEATSALDNESEAIVQKAMDNLMQNRTVFIIAHRLSTIKNADRIAVINDGELVELGKHDELVNTAGSAYKALYEMQFRQQENA
ncbi:MAG: ABC transporter ATP-binding protein [Lentisphaeria bacterium]|nr:ABC transporter ATP-binding protein [Lentisphaeria bacterium]